MLTFRLEILYGLVTPKESKAPLALAMGSIKLLWIWQCFCGQMCANHVISKHNNEIHISTNHIITSSQRM